jgi:hypothetical protein
VADLARSPNLTARTAVPPLGIFIRPEAISRLPRQASPERPTAVPSSRRLSRGCGGVRLKTLPRAGDEKRPGHTVSEDVSWQHVPDHRGVAVARCPYGAPRHQWVLLHMVGRACQTSSSASWLPHARLRPGLGTRSWTTSASRATRPSADDPMSTVGRARIVRSTYRLATCSACSCRLFRLWAARQPASSYHVYPFDAKRQNFF